MGATYAWASPDAIANLTEKQLFGYSRQISYVWEQQASYLAVQIAPLLGIGLKTRGAR